MAIWQYSFELGTNKHSDRLCPENENENMEGDIEGLFGSMFNTGENFRDFGSYESHRCTLYFSGNKITEAWCRIDMRVLNNEKFRQLIEFLDDWNLYVVDPDHKIIMPHEFLDNIRRSQSYKFITNPNDFFKKLEN